MIIKQQIFGLLVLLFSVTSYAQDDATEEIKALTPENQELLAKIVGLVDEGLSEAVVPDFDLLAKKYPNNYLVQYERAYNLYSLGRYDENRKALLSHKLFAFIIVFSA